MDRNRFIKVLETFADDPEALDRARAQMVVQVQNQLLEFKVSQQEGDVHVTENEHTERAESWIRDRLANLRLLAQRIIDVTPDASEYISPSGHFIDVLEKSPTGQELFVENAFETLTEQIHEGAGLSTYVIYLTADAGEGKTTTVQQLALREARRYLQRQTATLVVPIYLGGQPFIRLDDMIIGSIANTYRFRNLYIESFIELVRMGAIVPAFDGFEEMFVVGSSGEAVSSLGNFVENLESSGCVLVSARTAYFEIRDFSAQARLFDSMNQGDVAFSRLKLDRWDKARFLKYWDLRCMDNGEHVWDTLTGKFNAQNHPLLTRAVLVSKLADIAEDAGQLDQLIQRISRDASSYFAALIDSIIERELTKWLDRAEAKVRKPLLTVEEHHELLAQIAVEMTTSSQSEISFEELNAVAEMYCEAKRIPANISRQVLSRLPDHPLLRKASAVKRSLIFDHEEFRDFFTGEALGRFICMAQQADYKNLMRHAVITQSAAEACFVYLKDKCQDLSRAINFIKKAMTGEEPSSNIRESSSRILARMLTLLPRMEIVPVEGCIFEPEAFRGVELRKVHFKNCYFHRFDVRASVIADCTFSESEFAAIEWDSQTTIQNAIIHSDCRIYEAYNASDDLAVFDPKAIVRSVKRLGFGVEKLAEEEEPELPDKMTSSDENLSIAEKALRAFQRSNGLSENVLKVKLGKHYPQFSAHILPRLSEARILEEEKYEGKGHQHYYRLRAQMSNLQQAIISSQGDFEKFLSAFSS